VSEERPTRGEGEGGEAPEPEGPPPVPRCEVCGAELEPDQTYCMECGSPTPLAPRLRRGGRALAILAGAMVILGIGAGALAYAVVSDDDDDAVGTVTSATETTAPTTAATAVPPPLTGPLPTDTSFTIPTAPTTPTDPGATGTGFETVTGPTTPTAPATTQETEPSTQTEPATGSSDWPAGRTAWTAILSSVRSEADARAAKARLSGSGETAGVLFSSDYPGLEPGYWVVFSGSFPARAAAESHATELSSQFPGAYARRIEG
jgi:SPOR domain/zinc-ribbon domain